MYPLDIDFWPDQHPVEKWTVIFGFVLGGVGIIHAMWSKRSPFRRCVVWVFMQLIGKPVSGGVANVIATQQDPKLAALGVELNSKIDALAAQMQTLSDRNDAQHTETAKLQHDNAAKINRALERIDQLGVTLSQTNSRLANTTAALADHLLLTPGLPKSVITGEIPITRKDLGDNDL